MHNLSALPSCSKPARCELDASLSAGDVLARPLRLTARQVECAGSRQALEQLTDAVRKAVEEAGPDTECLLLSAEALKIAALELQETVSRPAWLPVQPFACHSVAVSSAADKVSGASPGNEDCQDCLGLLPACNGTLCLLIPRIVLCFCIGLQRCRGNPCTSLLSAFSYCAVPYLVPPYQEH